MSEPEVHGHAEQMQEAVRERRDPTDEEMEFGAIDPRTMLFETTRRRLEKCLELPERSARITELKDFARRTLDNPSVDYALPVRDIDEDKVFAKLSKLGPAKCEELAHAVLSDLAEARPALRELIFGKKSLTVTEALLSQPASRELLHSLCTMGTIPCALLRPFPEKYEREFTEVSSGKFKRGMKACLAGFAGAWAGANIYIRMADVQWYYSLPLIIAPLVGLNLGLRHLRKQPLAKDMEIFTAAASTLLLIEPLIMAPQPVKAGLEMYGGMLPNKHKWIETGNCVVALSLFQTPLRTVIADSLSSAYDGTTNKIAKLRSRVAREARRWGVENREEFTRLYKALHTRRIFEEYELRMAAQERALKEINLPVP